MNKWRLTLESGSALREAISTAFHATEDIKEKQA